MILVVGAHSRNVGKTSIICSILKGTPEIPWTAVKISANRRSVGGGLEISEQLETGGDADSDRYLAAGADRAFWLRAADSRMDEAARQLKRLAFDGGHLIVESNRIVEHLEPDLYLLALDFSVEDFKDSARRLCSRADGYVVSPPHPASRAWPGIAERLNDSPRYKMFPPDYRPRGLIRDVRTRLGLRVDQFEVA